jgi:hypothetical protein
MQRELGKIIELRKLGNTEPLRVVGIPANNKGYSTSSALLARMPTICGREYKT